MQVRRTVVYTILILLLAIAAAIFAGMHFMMIPAIAHIESREASNSVLRTVGMVENELGSLEGTAIDWSQWDDTYFFATDRNGEYVKNNLMDKTFTSLQLNLMLYYDLNGTLFYGKGYDYLEFERLEIPQALAVNPAGDILDEIRRNERVEDASIRGIISLPEGLLLLSINPILKSDSTGPAAGYLCIGRYLGDAEVAKIAQLTSTDLSVISAADAGTAWGVMHETLSTQEGSAIVRISPEGNTITSFVVIDDIHGVPAAVFRVDSPRTTHQIAMESLLLFLYLIAAIGCISVLFVIYILDHRFLKRLSLLEKKMKEIADRQDFSARTRLSGDDELSSLSAKIDHTLDALEEHINAERAAVESARIANEKLTLLSKITRHDILNQVTVIRGFADLSRDALASDSPANPFIDRISSASAAIEEQLAFTREYELGGDHAKPAWFNIRDLATGIVRTMPLCEIDVDIDTGDLEIYSDPLLERVIFNLVDNSLGHGEKVTTIRLRFYEEEGSGVLVYEDNGVGIPYHQKEIIFEQGFGRHRGLGLFLAKGVLSVTGITLKETGVPGEGARFEMRVPKGLFRLKQG
ncbi:MAG: sensor protein KdpD [Methanoregulaceae archaeon PtaB.Bin009]|jgi:sensor domain CHASE-containing protein/two-component sensor histidine kinase|nr:MAG: sensor protein KdpD [Methanoregulaceae archaeon PtaB.Bin009]OPY42240.1 MAG: sensor protein KdpD [Methanoregulaceae archaeon PtaU1.Bin066]